MNFNNPMVPSTVGHSSGQTAPTNYWTTQPGMLTGLNNLPPHHQSNTLAYFHNPHSLQPATSSHLPGTMQNQIPASSTLPELKKHKRTRSGCFTCRSRRVKCDETRPICGRCSKGKRECVYPPPQVTKKESRSNIKSSERFPSITESGSEDDSKGTTSDLYKRPKMQGRRISQHKTQGIKQGTVPPRGKLTHSFSNSRPHTASDSILFSIQDKSPSSSSDLTASADSYSPGSSSANTADTVLEVSSSLTYSHLPDLSGLKDDIQFFLSYRAQHISYRHYMFKHHAAQFVNEDLMRLALEYEPLLYAVVTFAAYHYSVSHPGGKLYTFLQYYDHSVTLLLKALKSGEAYHDAMLLTVLQLATFEEYVGDWANLVDHHQGAHRMLLELYTPESINEDDFHHHILIWYTRFDAMSAMMGGGVTVLSRDWYVEAERSTSQDAANNPDNLAKKIKAFTSQQKRFAMDFSSLIAKTSQGLITPEEFTAEREMVEETFDAITRYLESMKDPRYAITRFPNQQAPSSEDVFDPYVPGLIFGGPCYEVNLCHLEYLNYFVMFKYQMGKIQQNLDFIDLKNTVSTTCQVMEAMDRLPDAPKDLPIMHQNSLGLVCVFVPHDQRHWHWCRRKLAEVERLGYLYPPSFRRRMAEFWKKPELTTEWWLQDEEEPPKLMQEIRAWVQERTMSARDPFREAVREVRALFGQINIDDNSSISTMSSPSTHPEKSPEYVSP